MTINVNTSPDVNATVVTRLPTSTDAAPVVTESKVVDIRRTTSRAIELPKEPKLEATVLPPSSEQLRAKVDELNQNSIVRRNLQFNIDEDTGITVITVRDSQSDEVIRQIPSEELLSLARRVKEMRDDAEDIKGVLLHAKA